MGFALLLHSTTEGWSLPPCKGSPASSWSTVENWTDCVGTDTYWWNKYVGEWKDGKRHGQGTETWTDGKKYVGEYKDGKWHGKGTYTSSYGSKYVGEWKDDKRNGQGTYTYANGDKYVGEYKNAKRNGQGTYTFGDGSKYVGEHKNGLRHGQGTETDAKSGNKYVGEWKNGWKHGKGTYTFADGRVREGIWEINEFLYAKKLSPTVIAKEPKPSPKSGASGSGFFISRKGHVITNQHIVSDCRKVTVGNNSKKQVTANVLETDRRNDLALLRISNMQMASVETKSLIRKLGIKVVPLATDGLMRSEDVELGENVLVAGYPYGGVFSDDIKVNKGMVSGLRGMGDDTGQFQIDAAVQPGNSGGPIYDENGNIVGVVMARLNKMKLANVIGSIPENANFGIKASAVRQFLTSSGLPTKWSSKSTSMSTNELAKIAEKQTLLVVCHQ